ncbi:MAG: hypothetical protein JOY85_19005 [Acidobacteriaceae bacterium]|nr:hypothetical protein [Acidobacteriaceae bacterium]
MPRTSTISVIAAQQYWKAAGVLFLAGGFMLYCQTVDPRIKAKGVLGLEARANFTVPPPTAVGTFIQVDVPDPVTGKPASYTNPAAVNQIGAITGTYGDKVGSGSHGFVRSPFGVYSTFDVPGSVNGTFPLAINDLDVVAGYYSDNVGSGYHGFVGPVSGPFKTIDPPGSSYCCLSMSINLEGSVAGSYLDVNSVQQSFLRTPDGEPTPFYPPNAANGSAASTITLDGTILGVYYDVNNVSHGYRRSPFGAFTDITGPDGAPGQANPYAFLVPALSINPVGTIAGSYFAPMAGNPYGGDYRGFVKYPNGEYATFDAAQYPPCCIFTSPAGINLWGTVTGLYNDGFSIYHGFLRTRNGTITTFDAPGAGTGAFQGTIPLGITLTGVVAGIYLGPNDGNFLGVYQGHGFIFVPQDHDIKE